MQKEDEQDVVRAAANQCTISYCIRAILFDILDIWQGANAEGRSAE